MSKGQTEDQIYGWCKYMKHSSDGVYRCRNILNMQTKKLEFRTPCKKEKYEHCEFNTEKAG